MRKSIPDNPLSPEALSKIFKPLKSNPKLIGTKESVSVEYKAIFESGKIWKYAKTIAAFANHLGGYLIFGIKDKPHELIGMDKDSLKGFNRLDPQNLYAMLSKHFSPEIRCEMYVYEYEGKSFGVIYTYENKQKPVLCRASHNNEDNTGNIIDEGDIYYRYSGSSAKIKFPELFEIIQNERNKVHEQWMRTLGQITSAGLEKVSVLDLESKALISDGAPVYIDEDLASQLSFVKEGHFVDNGGNPTLVLKGTVETATGAHPIAMPEKIPTTINDTEIIEAFLRDKNVQKPELYIKQICFQSSGNLPVYFFMKKGNLSVHDTLDLLNSIERSSSAKKTLEKRLREQKKSQGSLGQITSESGRKKQYYHDRICRGYATPPSNSTELKYFLAAVRGMEANEVELHKDVVLEALYSVFKTYLYKDDYKEITGEFRYACCWVDEVLNS